MKKFIFSFSLFLMFLLWIYSVHAQSEWLLNPWFTDPALQFDTGYIMNQGVTESPDNWKWGYSCYKWDKSGIHPIEWCRVKSYYAGTDDYNVYIAGNSLSDFYNCYFSDNPLIGVVKLVQGNVWSDSYPWYIPPKMSINSGDIYIDSWYNVISFNGYVTNFLFDVWFKDDSTGNRTVLDLFFARTVSLKGSWMDKEGTFHYQADVCGSGGWQHCNFKVNPYIENAISAARSQGFNFNKATTYIYQTEILFELCHGAAELEVGEFRLYVTPTTTTTTTTPTTRPTTTSTIKPTPTTIRGGGGGGRMPLRMETSEGLNNPIVILVALIAIVVIIYGAFKFFARRK